MLHFCKSRRPEIVWFSSVLVASLSFPVIKRGIGKGGKISLLAVFPVQTGQHKKSTTLLTTGVLPELTPLHLYKAKDFSPHPQLYSTWSTPKTPHSSLQAAPGCPGLSWGATQTGTRRYRSTSAASCNMGEQD